MHHLHPRSRTTSTLFTTALAISFLVVALPHLLPCPVDRRQFADTIENAPDGSKIRRRKRRGDESDDDATRNEDGEGMEGGRRARECPVPKPGGLMGQMMGFEQQREREKERPVQVVVQSLRGRRVRGREVSGEDDGEGRGRR